MPTRIAPAKGTPKCASNMGGVLGHRKATRSPLTTPMPCKAVASRFTRWLQLPVGVARIVVDNGCFVRIDARSAGEETQGGERGVIDRCLHHSKFSRTRWTLSARLFGRATILEYRPAAFKGKPAAALAASGYAMMLRSAIHITGIPRQPSPDPRRGRSQHRPSQTD